MAGWFAVRCVFDATGTAGHDDGLDGRPLYEERITLWEADSHEEAVRLAEAEALGHAGHRDAYLGLAQSYELVDAPAHGAEVFSLLRRSDLDAESYLTAFFDSGSESVGEIE